MDLVFHIENVSREKQREDEPMDVDSPHVGAGVNACAVESLSSREFSMVEEQVLGPNNFLQIHKVVAR
jgi:hypothetical protein